MLHLAREKHTWRRLDDLRECDDMQDIEKPWIEKRLMRHFE
jgi:hypothetical protein